MTTMDNEQSQFYLDTLHTEFENRRQKNRAYSLRSFAKCLEVDAGTLSRLLNKRQIPTYFMATRLSKKLKLTAEQETEFFRSVSEASEKKMKARSAGFWKSAQGYTIKDLDITLYEVIADWYHMAIMEMTFLKDANLTPENISKKLGITTTEAEAALQRLISLGLIEAKEQKLVKRNQNLSTSQKNITTEALKRNQKQFLMKAIDSLEKEPIDKRTVTSMTMAVDPKRLLVAKKMIRDFNQTLCKFLERGNRTRIYNLSVALNPLDKED